MKIEDLSVAAYTIPTASPESDGTFEWRATTLVAVNVRAGGKLGFGYSYADEATATLIRDSLAQIVRGRDPFAIDVCWAAMIHQVRNLGRRGIAAMAISAIDNALWDLKAKLLGIPLVKLLGQVRASAPVYGSGGFTSYTIDELQQQLGGWAQQGIPRVKMKIGRDAKADRERVAAARQAIGPDCELFVDANGAYARKQAIEQAEIFSAYDVRWFEEPVSSDDLDGLHWIRECAPASMDIAAGEYGYELQYFDEMIAAGAVDVLQADATRCCGITGLIKTSAICEARSMPLSAHCAPSLHAPLGCALLPMRHLEYFFDHVRIESMLFDGFIAPRDGAIHPDLSRPGLGVELKVRDAQQYAA
ncbi:MAG TPA: enolase C-terminal domain-like protein [Thermoanaerobaculia bacterium]|nr:enolase C-terminal domain-like protein [Thermoanaerobaculia bacterium]